MIASLLVPVDSSTYAEPAQEQAVALAKAYQARVTGLYVLDVRYLEMPPYVDYSYAFEAVPQVIPTADLMDSFKAKSEHILGELAEFVRAAGLSVETRAEEGVPSQVIAEVGRAHDLIVMGKRGEHAKWTKDFLGSTAEQVTRRSATPVLLVEPVYRPLSKALVLFDGSNPANRAVKLAAELAARTGLTLKVLTADDDAASGAATQAEASAYLGPLGLAVEYAVVPGRAARAVTALLAEEPADVVIMGMRGHSALHDFILGSTAEHLMRSTGSPVLLVP
jgi:nucleotide-binding universal stress UspA family protein